MHLIYLMNGSLIIKQRKSLKHKFMDCLSSPPRLAETSGKDVREKGGYLQAFHDSWVEGNRDEVAATGEA